MVLVNIHQKPFESFQMKKKIAPGGIRTQNLLFAPYNSTFEGAGSNPKQAKLFFFFKF